MGVDLLPFWRKIYCLSVSNLSLCVPVRLLDESLDAFWRPAVTVVSFLSAAACAVLVALSGSGSSAGRSSKGTSIDRDGK